jgi:predicted ATPase
LTLRLANFKGVRDETRIELRPITLLFGPNSAGKSTLLQALLYLHEILERHNTDPGSTQLGGDAVDLGGFKQLVHARDIDREVTLALNLGGAGFDLDSLSVRGAVADVLDECPDGIGVTLKIGWSHRLERPIVRSFDTEYGGDRVAVITSTADGTRAEIDVNASHYLFARGFSELVEAPFDQAELLDLIPRSLGVDLGLRGALPSLQHGFEVDAYQFERMEQAGYGLFPRLLNGLVCEIASRVRDFLRELIYIGPLRTLPPRNYTPPRVPDRGRWATGLAAWDLLHYRSDDEVGRVGAVLRDTLQTGYGLVPVRSVDRSQVEALLDGADDGTPLLTRAAMADLVSERRVMLKQVGQAGITVAPSDIGVGVSQVLPVAAATVLDLCPERWEGQPLVVVEQPERHVHPAIQVELGDMFIRAARTDHRRAAPTDDDFDMDDWTASRRSRRTFLLETHSEHLMLRLLRRIEETTAGTLAKDELALKSEDVAVYHVQQVDGCTEVRELRIDESGEFLDPWPRGFFEERRKELF